MKTRNRQLVALDLGSSKIVALICEARENGRVELRGAGPGGARSRPPGPPPQL